MFVFCLLCYCVWFLLFFVVVDLAVCVSFCLCGMSVFGSSVWVLLACVCSGLVPLHLCCCLFACFFDSSLIPQVLVVRSVSFVYLCVFVLSVLVFLFEM